MQKRRQNQIYQKLIVRYVEFFGLIATALTLFFLFEIRNNTIKQSQAEISAVLDDTKSYIEQCDKLTGDILFTLNRSSAVLDDLTEFLLLDSDEYWSRRLDSYSSSPWSNYEGFNAFFDKVMQERTQLVSIELISLETGTRTICLPDKTVYQKNDAKEYIKRIADGNLSDMGRLSFAREIRDFVTLKPIGYMVLDFSTEHILSAAKLHPDVQLSVSNWENRPIVSTAHIITYEPNENIYSDEAEVRSLLISAWMPKAVAERVSVSTFVTVFALGLGIFCLSTYFMRKYLLRMSGRIGEIISAMNKVTTGDLSVRLSYEESGDELEIISSNFNNMCVKLDQHIQRSYLAEIEQRNAEMEALNNQINPHFLYNTLEAVRMKAVSGGEKEVARMLFLMATLFRNQSKSNDNIPLSQELDYCKSYIELMSFRHTNHFVYEISCPDKLKDYIVMKFSLQPIIENYFVHGIRKEAFDNYVRVKVEEENNKLMIHIQDNGRGMSQEQMEEKNSCLAKPKAAKNGKSIGLENVNRRLKAFYGEEYGVTLKQNEPAGGICVMITIEKRIGVKPCGE